jgi:glycosyltransferase involved in cell wall biosynthesis
VKVLHLFANWKWTGPAEPAVNLAAALRDRGVAVEFACGRAVAGLENEIEGALAARDLRATPGLRLGKHRNPFLDPLDRRALGRLLSSMAPDLLHCHLPNDHRIGLGAARSLKRRPRIVRSLYDGEPPKADKDLRALLGPGADAVLAVSRAVAEALPGRTGVDAEKVFLVEGAVDTDRFAPRSALPRLAADYGLRKEDFVVGVVARMQRHRRFEVFFDAVAAAAEAIPELKVLLVGRGTWMDEVAVRPAARKGLAGRVIFTGYRRGAEYADTLRCMSVKTFLVPGSDGSCRAVREALSCGVPVVSTRRGMLPEIVEDGATGILADETADSFAEALVRLARDEPLRRRMAKAAREAARERFSLPAQARRVESIYRWLLGKGDRPPSVA